jgi:DNA-binding NarL/FixJ family response regulator
MRELSDYTILVIDDHEVVRAGLIQGLSNAGLSKILQASSVLEAHSLISTHTIDLLLIDYQLEDGVGIDIAHAALLHSPQVKLILLTLYDEWKLVEQARRAGFTAFISKNSSLSTIVEQVIGALDGALSFRVFSQNFDSEISIPLTTTEIAILEAISKGHTTREIAALRLNSEATIKSHLSSIYRKLGVRNRVEAITWAAKGVR